MTTIYPIRYRACEHGDRLAVSAFLTQIQNEQSVVRQPTAHKASNLFARSKIVGGMHNSALISLIAYNVLDNVDGKSHAQTAKIQGVTIAKKYRTTRIFYTGLRQVAAQCVKAGIHQIELWIPEQSRWLNKCCAALATPIGTQLDQDEQCCVVYRTDVERIQTVLKQHNIQSIAYLPGYDSMMMAMVQAM